MQKRSSSGRKEKKRKDSEQNKVKREWERILKTTPETENESSIKSRTKV